MNLVWLPANNSSRFHYLMLVTTAPYGGSQTLTVAKLYWKSGHWNISIKDDTVGELAYRMCEERIAAIAAERMGV